MRDIEAAYVKRIETILSPIVGDNNVRAQVAADVDFSQTDQVAETFRPNPQPGTAIRSQLTAESGSGSPAAAGIPGALSNQPPAPATAPQSLTGESAGLASGASGTQNFSKSATQTGSRQDRAPYQVAPAPSAAYRPGTPPSAATPRAAAGAGKPLPAVRGHLAINDLAREAMGYNQTRRHPQRRRALHRDRWVVPNRR